MLLDLDQGRLWVFLIGLLVFGVLESLWPAGRRRGPRAPRWVRHGLMAAVNTVLVRTLVFVPLLLWMVWLEEQGWGLLRMVGLIGIPELILSVLLLDAFDYVWHRANHRIPFLWRFHKVHHSDNALDVTTALRFHPGELLLSGLAKAGWLAVLGPTPVAWFLFEALVSASAQFHHADLRLAPRLERALRGLWVTPAFHGAHHLVDRRWGDRNFSTLVPWWDLLFGSFEAPPAPAYYAELPEPLGLPEGRAQADHPAALLLGPFRGLNQQGMRHLRPQLRSEQ
jgi:sterol desaturase/sphingolipid hydroxylase (fatty acid hydroxylase superfamily)